MARVLICDQLESAGVRVLEEAGVEVDNRPGLKGEALAEALRAADAAIVRSATQITAELLENPGKLRAVARAGVGTDNINVAAATRQGVVVMNTPGGNTVSAAEHTIALMMAMSRHVAAADAVMKAGRWDRNKFVGSQLAGKTLGVVGLGRIGREVAKRAIGLEMKVAGHDPFVSPERAAEWNIKGYSSVDELLPHCDYLTLHVPLSDTTKSLIGARELGMLPKGARVLNVSRGGIIDEAALTEALTAGTLAGAALDVFVKEPPPADHPLLKAPRLVLTPHLGASTTEAQEAVAVEAANLLVDFLQRGVIACAVNVAAVNRAELDQMRPFIDLARRLGMLQAQIARGPVRKAHLTFRGDLAQKNTKLLAAAFAAGLMETRVEGVNIVNAEVLAGERGVEIVASSTPTKGDFANLIHTEVIADGTPVVAAGTLFGNQYLRLVQFNDYRLDAYLEGVTLLFLHHDVPGLIGSIGTIFGRHDVNIARMTVGRNTGRPGGQAIGALNLDSVPSEAAIQEVRANPAVTSVEVARLPDSGVMPAWLG